MLRDVESKFLDVDILRALVKEVYHQAMHNPCSFTRGRAGWELHKLNKKYEQSKMELVQICDQSVSEEELSEFLSNQQIQFKKS